MWHYITLIDNNLVKCDICDTYYRIEKTTDRLITHILNQHTEFYYYILGSNINWEQYYVIQHDQAKCHICDRNLLLHKMNMSLDLEIHLIYRHGITMSKVRALQDWLRLHFNLCFDEKQMYYVEAECNICNTIFQVSNSFTLIKHMYDDHEINVPPILRPSN